MKSILITLALIAVIIALASAGLFMLRGQDAPQRRSQMAWALAVRVGLSVVLFVCILLAWKFGWIEPTGLPVSR